jgi:hypothetical protein
MLRAAAREPAPPTRWRLRQAQAKLSNGLTLADFLP